jgi:GTP pyrophosphokinase
MLKELTAVISDENTDIRAVDLSRDDEGEAIIEFVVEAEDVRHLNRMVLGLRRVEGVRQVQRTQKV